MATIVQVRNFGGLNINYIFSFRYKKKERYYGALFYGLIFYSEIVLYRPGYYLKKKLGNASLGSFLKMCNL